MPTWLTQGKHRYYCEADVVFFELHGLFSLEDTQCLYAQAQVCAKDWGYYLSVFDARDGLSMSPAARRYTSEIARQRTIDGATMIIGASRTIRAMTHLLLNAASLFGKELTPVFFCATPEELPQWLADQRRHFQQKGVGPGPW